MIPAPGGRTAAPTPQHPPFPLRPDPPPVTGPPPAPGSPPASIAAGPRHALPSRDRCAPSIALPARHDRSRRVLTREVRVVPGEQRSRTSAFLLPSQRDDTARNDTTDVRGHA